jgi:hypothetical protein
MPSQMPIDTTEAMLEAAQAGVGERRPTADVHTGSGYDVQAGVGAILWVREENRDRSNFAAVFMDTAEGADLDWRITHRNGPPRVVATRGAGTALLRFAGAPTAGTIWTGTRIAVTGLAATPRMFRVAADTAILATDTGKIVPIEAEAIGTGTAINTAQLGGARVVWEDSIFNAGWTVASLSCADGTDRETDTAYRSRWRQGKLDRRVGYPKAISDAMIKAGARYVVMLASDFEDGGIDQGINRVWVADERFQSPLLLLNKCRKAIDSVRVLGCDLTVWGITRTPVTLDLTVHLTDEPCRFDQAAIRTAVQDGVLHYFSSRDNGFMFKRDGLRAYAMQGAPDVQSLDFGAGDPVDSVVSVLMESTALPLLYTTRDLIGVTLAGPV